MPKLEYKGLKLSEIRLEMESQFLGGSIVNSTTIVTAPRGQQVEDVDFSKKNFSTEWEVSSDPS